YASLISAPLREEPLVRAPRHFAELELQAHWFAGDFGREFTTMAGERVRVVQFGVWNREAGPDFADAAISLNGGEPRLGCIELDPDARDWERHGHAANPEYETVVLHVFTRSGGGEFFTRTAQHRNVPQVLLDLSRLDGAVVNPQPAAREGRCAGPLRDLPEEKVREVLLGAAQFRLRRKSAALARLIELHGADEALFQALAATLGYKSNKLPFTLLAQRLPLKLLRRGETDALLFGVSGFLPASDLGAFDSPTRAYLRGLWEKWWPQRAEFGRLTLGAELWKLSGQRPANHPQRRLAALAQIVRHWPKIRALAKRCEPAAAHEFFAKLSDPYWDFHYTVTSKRAAKRMALVGESRVTEMLANVFFPLALLDDEARWIGFKNLPAALTNRRVEVAALRLFGASDRARTLLRNAAMQQGLLQIYEDFCMRDASDCARCLFPRQLAKW
ncbi:MAG TPA: DUF2851 family protein, partial [Chthoniobacteraceae bacterium]|nr:DUF2851 family protein [Chthoniobacteraceae bacterium]